jgi:hypothetical protein
MNELSGTRKEESKKGIKVIWSGETTEERNGVAIIVSPTYAEMVTYSECI